MTPQPTESAILAALADYRAHIGEVNRRAMMILIPQIEAAHLKDPDFVLNLVGIPKGNTEPPIERASDILDLWDVIAPQVALDGASVNADAEWRAAMLEIYRSAILEGLGRLECPTGQWELPHYLEILMRHVDSLEGPGWRYLRDVTERLIFWEGGGLHDGIDNPDRINRSVMTGQAIMHDNMSELDSYDAAGGWA